MREGGEIRTSSNGLSWNLQTSGVTADLRAILWDGANFLVGGQNGTILRSSDRVNWQQVSNSGPFINALAFSGSRYIAAGGFGLKVSSDGITWRNPNTPPSSYSWKQQLGREQSFISAAFSVLACGRVRTAITGLNPPTETFHGISNQ